MAQVKCAWCEVRGDKSLCVQEANKKYYHFECHTAYIKDKEFKQKEAAAKLKLSKKIAEVYELDSYKLIPSSLYPYIEDLRNDSTLFGKLGKNYKMGIPFEGIAYTYTYCQEKISDARKNKTFENFMAELKYGLAIVRNNLVDAKNHAIQQKRNEKINSNQFSSISESEKYISETIVVSTKKKDDMDISDIL